MRLVPDPKERADTGHVVTIPDHAFLYMGRSVRNIDDCRQSKEQRQSKTNSKIASTRHADDCTEHRNQTKWDKDARCKEVRIVNVVNVSHMYSNPADKEIQPEYQRRK